MKSPVKTKNRVLLIILVCIVVLFAPTVINKLNGQYVYKFSGTVKDSSGEPIIGAGVICISCGYFYGLPLAGTTTDINGYYQLVGSEHRGHTFEFSAIGYKTKQVDISQFVNNVVLEEDNE